MLRLYYEPTCFPFFIIWAKVFIVVVEYIRTNRNAEIARTSTCIPSLLYWSLTLPKRRTSAHQGEKTEIKEKKRRLCKSVDIHALCTIRGAIVTSHLSPGCSFFGIPAERIRCTDSVPSAVYILDSSRTMYKSRSPKKLPPVALPARAGVTVDFVRQNHNTGILCYRCCAAPRLYAPGRKSGTGSVLGGSFIGFSTFSPMPLTAVEPCDEFGELKYGHLLGLLTCGHALQPLRHLKKDAPRPVLDVPSRTRLHCDPARGKTLRVEPETERTNAWKRSVRQNIYPFGSVHVFWRNSFRPNSLYGQPRTEEAMTRCVNVR